MDILSTGFNIILIVIGFGLLITVHEFGHFIAARWAGIRVEAFAIGMGPPLITFKRGIGLRFGSTDPIVKARTGMLPHLLSRAEQMKYGLGETEYSLRMFPLGGYVKMLGQEDGNPGAVSDDLRSYTSTSIGKRMVVVSAGVIMNLITAIVLFVAAFLVGVRFEAPVVGFIEPDTPAASAVSSDPAITGFKPGDKILSIDGSKVETFGDVMLASALSAPGQVLSIEIQRKGVEKPIVFSAEPKKIRDTGLRQLGITPASTNILISQPEAEPLIATAFANAGADKSDAKTLAGWRIVAVDGVTVSTWVEFDNAVKAANGKSVSVIWSPPEGSSESKRTTTLTPEPRLEEFFYKSKLGNDYTPGLVGLVPLIKIRRVIPESANNDVLESDDVILAVEGVNGPRLEQFKEIVSSRPNEKIGLVVLRNGETIDVTAQVSREGMIGTEIGYALNLPKTGSPLLQAAEESGGEETLTPISPLQLLPRTRIDSIQSIAVTDWKSMRRALIESTTEANDAGKDATVELAWTLPLEEKTRESGSITISKEELKRIHALGFQAPLGLYLFEPLQTTLSADGNPFKAIAMGFQQTWKMVISTYLTIHRLTISRSVPVDQLHGPVGIVHLGVAVADRGFTYLVFFLALISVNLAVLNFLPLPIVDGGLFLFLIYEKFRGRPPSIAFQNGAALVGIMLIGALFLMTFYFDIMRLAS